jgi:hypothetical protein
MSLSLKTIRTLTDCLSDKSATNALVNAITHRTALDSKTKEIVIENLCADKKAGLEIVSAVVSGAKLSQNASRSIIQQMAGDGEDSGNELINFIQSVPNKRKIML